MWFLCCPPLRVGQPRQSRKHSGCLECQCLWQRIFYRARLVWSVLSATSISLSEDLDSTYLQYSGRTQSKWCIIDTEISMFPVLLRASSFTFASSIQYHLIDFCLPLYVSEVYILKWHVFPGLFFFFCLQDIGQTFSSDDSGMQPWWSLRQCRLNLSTKLNFTVQKISCVNHLMRWGNDFVVLCVSSRTYPTQWLNIVSSS